MTPRCLLFDSKISVQGQGSSADRTIDIFGSTLRSGHPFSAIGVIFLQILKALQHGTRPHSQCVFGEASDAPI